MSAAWVFTKDGCKVVDGRRLQATATTDYRSSNGRTIYTVTTWQDRTKSCNCPSWTLRVKDGERSCKHVRGECAPITTSGREPNRVVEPRAIPSSRPPLGRPGRLEPKLVVLEEPSRLFDDEV